jgi:Rrf2 family transcriptional regulator, cysteine metabolism repressor
MTLLSRKADYALLILQYLHVNGSGNAREIAERFHLSKAFVANILKELRGKNFLHSTHGVKGGYVLARASAAVTLAELIESLEDGFKLTVCNEHGEAGNCEVAAVCPVKAPMTEMTLADVFSPPPASPPVPVLATLGIRTPTEPNPQPKA